MNDPHVSHLRYRADSASFIELVEGAPIDVETNAFRVRLSAGKLVLEMHAHFASESDARSVADPFVKGWAIASGLRRGRPEISFEFEGSEIVDRSPPSDGGNYVSVAVQLPPVQVHATAISHPIRTGYPRAAPNFLASREVEVLWARHQAYIEGRESLTSMAYFCLTFVQIKAGGGNGRAAKKYKISRKVFDRIGALTGTRGDYLTARKVVDSQLPKPLTQDELRWLEAAVRVIIWRIGASPLPIDTVITADEVLACPILDP